MCPRTCRIVISLITVCVTFLFEVAPFSPRGSSALAVSGKTLTGALHCKLPIKVRLGEIDNRFSMEKSEAFAAIIEAGELWNNAAGRPVVQYDALNGVPVNFVYEEELKAAYEHAKIMASIRERRELIARTAKELADLRANIKSKEANLIVLEAEIRKAKYELEKAYSGKNVAADGTDALEVARYRLEQRAMTFKEEGEALRELLTSEKDVVARYNGDVGDINLLVEEANRDVGKKIVMGRTYAREKTQIIEVFLFFNRPDLVTILAHEIGHVLGLGHSESSTSIMTAARESGGLTSTNVIYRPDRSDIALLMRDCRD